MLRNFMRSKIKTLLQNDINFGNETESFRLLFNSYISEYKSIREEINERLNFQERLLGYIFVMTSLLLSFLKIFDSKLEIYYMDQPTIYLFMAIISLIFPVIYVDNNIMITTLGYYESSVLRKKINALIYYAGRSDAKVKEYYKWEKSTFPIWLHGCLRWHDYRSRLHFRTRALLFFVLSVFRFVFIFSLSGVFLVMFLSSKQLFMWNGLEKTLFIIYIFILIAIGIGSLLANQVYIKLANTHE